MKKGGNKYGLYLGNEKFNKKIKSENIIKGISIKIPKGETYGLLGPNVPRYILKA